MNMVQSMVLEVCVWWQLRQKQGVQPDVSTAVSSFHAMCTGLRGLCSWCQLVAWPLAQFCAALRSGVRCSSAASWVSQSSKPVPPKASVEPGQHCGLTPAASGKRRQW